MELQLRFDYGSIMPWVRRRDDGLAAIAGPDAVWLPRRSSCTGTTSRTSAELHGRAGETGAVRAHLSAVATGRAASRLDRGRGADRHRRVLDALDRPAAATTGRWQDAVRRALITLKALTYAPTGGIVAAATTSLPEQLGGPRNWDYRYCWLRDATFTLQALLGTGYVDEATAWREWLLRAVAGDPAELQIMYAPRRHAAGCPSTPLDWLSGYEGSRPVRIGNAAAGQFQLDVWGEVLDGLHPAASAGLRPAETALGPAARAARLPGGQLASSPTTACGRSAARAGTSSTPRSWRGPASTARSRPSQDYRPRRPGRPVATPCATSIHRDVCAHGFDAERNTFTQFYGSRGLDAALLLLPRVGFLPWTDPRIVGTVDAVRARTVPTTASCCATSPSADGDVDGLPGGEGAFLACSFWLVDALCTASAAPPRPRRLFERPAAATQRRRPAQRAVRHRAPAGRWATSPQAFSLVGLVNSALQLSAGPAQSKKTDLFAYK